MEIRDELRWQEFVTLLPSSTSGALLLMKEFSLLRLGRSAFLSTLAGEERLPVVCFRGTSAFTLDCCVSGQRHMCRCASPIAPPMVTKIFVYRVPWWSLAAAAELGADVQPTSTSLDLLNVICCFSAFYS